MTDEAYSELPFTTAEDDWPPAVVVEREPRRHRHVWMRFQAASETGPGEEWTGCSIDGCNAIRDPEKARRGKSSRRLGHDGERRSEKRYGWTKVGEFGGITDLQGTLAIVQQKTSRRPAPPKWRGIFGALEARAGGRIPLILLSFVRAGVDTEDFIVIRGRDWLALHGVDKLEADRG